MGSPPRPRPRGAVIAVHERPPFRRQALTVSSNWPQRCNGHRIDARRVLHHQVPRQSACGDFIDVADLRGRRWIAGPASGEDRPMGVWPGLDERPVGHLPGTGAVQHGLTVTIRAGTRPQLHAVRGRSGRATHSQSSTRGAGLATLVHSRYAPPEPPLCQVTSIPPSMIRSWALTPVLRRRKWAASMISAVVTSRPMGVRGTWGWSGTSRHLGVSPTTPG